MSLPPCPRPRRRPPAENGRQPKTAPRARRHRAEFAPKPKKLADAAAYAGASRAENTKRAYTKAPEVTEVLQGIRRTLGVAPNQKDPVLVDTLRALVEPMRRDDPGDVRDRALICLGVASGYRRSDLVALDVRDLSFGDDGLEVAIRRSKTDQAGFGRKVGIPYDGRPRTCPVRAVRD